MSNEVKGIQDRLPVWVESLLSPEEYRESHKLYPTTVLTPDAPAYDPTYHKGGRWRLKMGRGLSKEEIDLTNKELEKLYNLIKEKQHDV